MKTISDREEKLLKLLQSDERTILEQFSNAYISLNSKTAEEPFIEGFRLRAKIVIEVIQKDDGDLHDLVD